MSAVTNCEQNGQWPEAAANVRPLWLQVTNVQLWRLADRCVRQKGAAEPALGCAGVKGPKVSLARINAFDRGSKQRLYGLWEAPLGTCLSRWPRDILQSLLLKSLASKVWSPRCHVHAPSWPNAIIRPPSGVGSLGWAAWYFLFCIGGDRLVRATVRT